MTRAEQRAIARRRAPVFTGMLVALPLSLAAWAGIGLAIARWT